MGLRDKSEGGTGGLARKGLQNLSEISAIPDSAVFQLDANLLSASDGTTIQSWSDQIGDNELTGGDPSYSTTDELDPTVIGDGTDDELVDTSATGLPTSDNARTIILVLNTKSPSTNFSTFFSYGTNANSEQFNIQNTDRNTSGGDLAVAVNGGITVANSVYGTDEKHITTVRLPSSGTSVSDITLRDNGTDLTIDSTSDNSINTTLSYVSVFSANGVNYIDDGVSEVIVYDGNLTGPALTDEENRLADKWGITL
jgi:hypothetical protein